MATAQFDVLLENGIRETLFDDGYAAITACSFGEACFNAMIASDGSPCTLLMVVRGRDVKAWDICEGAEPDFDYPDGEAV